MIDRINIVSQIFGSSGYDSHCRQLANAMYVQHPNIFLDVPRPQDWVRFVSDNEYAMLEKDVDPTNTSIMVATPPYWRFVLVNRPKKFIGFCVWEGDKVPKYWLKYLTDKRIDQIWVPSVHTKEAIINTHSDETAVFPPIHIVPHGVDLSIFYPAKTKDKDRPFTFICNKGWRGNINDRGGVQFVLQAFEKAFNENDNVRLLLKLNPHYLRGGELNVKKVLQEYGVNKMLDKIEVITTNLKYREIADLYRRADVYVCAQMADGFNIPGIEAMACGLPTIQTNYGGQTDYMTKENSWFIPVKEMVEVTWDFNYEGVKWAMPDVDALTFMMKHCFENPDKVKEKGLQAESDAQNWTWSKSAEKALRFLELK